MIHTRRIYILFICLVFALGLKAQDHTNAIALKTVLSLIEEQHKVNFNYIDTEIEIFKITLPKKTLSLDQKLMYLREKTSLYYEKIDSKFISISNKKEDGLVCGFVYSRIDDLPQEGANVQTSNGINTTTDRNGYFKIKTNHSVEIFISHIGFLSKKTTIIDSNNNNCSTIYIDYEVLKLENVSANPILTSGISKGLDGTFKIKPKKTGILAGLIEPDVLQTMLQIPGINSTDQSLSSLNIRGGTHDQNLFLWNGIKMFQTGHFFGLISAFNPNLAHSITISKNGSSAFYGENVSSVVDISTDPNVLDTNNFSVGINMINADVYSKFILNKKGFLEIAGRKSITDIFKTPTYKEYFQKAFQNTIITDFTNNQFLNYLSEENFYFYDMSIKYFQKIGSKDLLVLDLITINDKLNVEQERTNTTISNSENNTISQKNKGGNLTWKRNWNTKNSSKINFYSSSYELNAKKSKIQEKQIIKQENTVLNNGVKLENNYIINSKFVINNGYQFEEIGTTNLDDITSPSFYRKIKEVLRTHAVIVEGKFNDTLSKIYLNAGIRINYTEQFKKHRVEPRLQFNFQITKDLKLEILGELKSQNYFQIIDLQKDYFGIEKRRWILSNNNTIPIQRSKQISFGGSYSRDNWLISFDNFYKKINGINSSSQGFQNQLEFTKLNGSYTIIGTELLLQKKINKWISWVSYTFNDNNYLFENITLTEFSNNFEIKHAISWSGSYETENLKIALGSTWHTGKPETSPLFEEVDTSDPLNPIITYNTPNHKNLDSFFQVNFSTTYKWGDSDQIQYKVGFSVLNVLNRKNEINEYYRINTKTNSIEDVNTYSLGRTPNLSLRVQF